MSTYTQILYQLVFATKHREPILYKDNRSNLYAYITGILQNKKCHVYQINGVADHLHILTHVHPAVAVSDLVKDIKMASSFHIKKTGLFKDFSYWQEGYGAFTYSINAKQNLINYIKNQEQHHQKTTFREEYIRLLKEHGVAFEEKYLL